MSRGNAVGAVDRRIAELARTQFGVVSRAQLLSLDIAPGEIRWRTRTARLHPIHRGVYLVGHSKPIPLAREMAAVLACGPRAVVSHRSAGAIWKLVPFPRGPVEVTLVGSERKRPDIKTHHTRERQRRDVRRHHRIPLTSPSRTLLDLASILRPAELERAIAEALALNLVRTSELADQLARHPARPGTPSLRALLESPGGPRRTRNDAERRLLDLVRKAGLPVPEANAEIAGKEVDALWRREGVVVEFDSWQFHSTRRAFERDRRRDAELVARGFRVIRVTWRQLTGEPHAVVARIAAALATASG